MWRVNKYKLDGGKTRIVSTESFPSRGAAARSLPNGKDYIHRDSLNCSYWILLLH